MLVMARDDMGAGPFILNFDMYNIEGPRTLRSRMDEVSGTEFHILFSIQ